MGCNLAAGEISETKSSCAMLGAFNAADANRIAFLTSSLITENSQSKTMDRKAAQRRYVVLPWLFSGMRLNLRNGMRGAAGFGL